MSSIIVSIFRCHSGRPDRGYILIAAAREALVMQKMCQKEESNERGEQLTIEISLAESKEWERDRCRSDYSGRRSGVRCRIQGRT